MYALALGLFALLSLGYTAPTSLCPPFQGTFNVSVLDLYPESADWDPVHCKIYFGLYYNASVAVYDPYRKTSEVITIPGITGNSDYTVTGIDYDGMGSMYFAATSLTAFQATTSGNTSLANFTGPNSIIRYDTNARKISWVSDLVPIHNEILQRTGKLVTGFQDMAEDNQGNSFVIGSFGSVIVKIDRNGTPRVWYEPKNINDTLVSGGIIRSGNKIIINDRLYPALVTFNIDEPYGTPVYVHPEGFPANYSAGTDALVAPSKYGGRVVLWSDDFYGTRVIGTRDNWETAEYLGLVLMDSSLRSRGGFTTDSFAVGNTIYSLTEFFQATKPIQTTKEFTMVDMTEQVDQLVRAWLV
ncbi:hypothetical protein OIDMADRAFT_56965 [Oidiodendron maius Zn]|uniref:Uncharacterized protein n=1 Tax=Oidiodendron maius (strain Zn) TaxID=913774 RepID=A0A0C3D9N0_OIDMZ|nr:hypothetical protein OIDMADRAFT_56965 [Oidiodendron maius Zn]